MRTILLLVVLIAVLGAAVWVAVQAWTVVETEIGWHGWIALSLGSVLSLAVGGGLMALVFYSSRRGFDDVDRDV